MTNQHVKYEDFVVKVFKTISGNNFGIKGPIDPDLVTKKIIGIYTSDDQSSCEIWKLNDKQFSRK